MIATFKPHYKLLEKLEWTVAEEDIREEPMIFQGDWFWCEKHAGPLTRAIMDKINSDVRAEWMEHPEWYSPVIDTKSVMLMPGMYPCIPGWHCDGVPRDKETGQPDTTKVNDHVVHYCVNFTSRGTCPTEFLSNEFIVPIFENETIWKQVDRQVNMYDMRVDRAESGEIFKFQREALHRGSPATSNCWGYFFRLSFSDVAPKNEIRNQVQVYTDLNFGW